MKKTLQIWLIKFLARNRNHYLIQKVNVLSRLIILGCENRNPDSWTNGETDLLKKLVHLNLSVVFDVGANIGDWSTAVSEIIKPEMIYAFEPVPIVYDQLVKNTAMAKVEPINFALGHMNGSIPLFFSASASYLSSSVVSGIRTDGSYIECNVKKGDDFCKERGIDLIDLLKIDTEGSDYLVLKGFESFLASKKIRIIQFEYGSFAIENKYLLKDFFELLTDYGFIIGKIYPGFIQFDNYSFAKENFILSNYIAIQKHDEELKSLFGLS